MRPRLLAGIALGTLVYEVTLRILTVPDIAVWRRENAVRNVVLWTLVVVAATVAAGQMRRHRAGLDAAMSAVMMGAGASWVLWGLVDQHALHLFHIAPDSRYTVFWDVVFHGVGALAVAIGWNLFDRVRQDAGGTFTTAGGGNS